MSTHMTTDAAETQEPTPAPTAQQPTAPETAHEYHASHSAILTGSLGIVAEGYCPFGRYRVEWDAQGRLVSQWVRITPHPVLVKSKRVAREPCIHLGSVLEKRQCKACSGKIMVKIHECKVHGTAVLRQPKSLMDVGAECTSCKDYDPRS